MGRFPFMAAVNDYMDSMKGVLAASTSKELERRYKRMHKDLQQLLDAGKVSTLHPEKINEQDVLAYLSCLRARGLKDESVSHNLITLCSVLRFSGNTAVDRAKMKYPQHFPKYTKQRLDPINDEDRLKIIETANTVPSDDWRRMLGYAIAVSGICSGLRPGELRKTKVYEIDLNRGLMHAEEVKGKGRYGEPRDAALHPDGVSFLRRYLRARAEMISKMCPTNDVLFPELRENSEGSGLYSQQGFSKLRLIVQKETGIVFDGRATRRTYGQTGIDQGVPVDAISRMLGHSSTKTTEKYYCRRWNDAAIAEARRVWDSQPALIEAKPQKVISPLIEKQKYLPGYG
jgi:integrase/recombinase XerD